MAGPEAVDRLPPEARFALRAVAGGAGVDDAGALMRLDAATVRKHLRTAARGLGLHAPPPSEGDAALYAALAPAVAAAREAPSRPSSKRCPEADVAEALAASLLDGPLLLAEIDHAADCPPCLSRLLALKRSGAAAPARAPSARGPRWPLALAVVAAIAAAAWYVLR